MKRRRTKGKKSGSGAAADQSAVSAADFSFSLCRIAISQICRSVGFRSAESTAVEILTLIATKHLQTLASSAASFSNAANRTESNLFDVVNALHDLYLSLGFPGGSAVHDPDETKSCSIRSSVLRDLSHFVSSTPEIPFAKPVPRGNIKSEENVLKASQANSPPRGKQVPNWLPAFPDASTYEESSVPPRSEKPWEDSESVRNGSGGEDLGVGGGGGSSGRSLPVKREKVRFKFGGAWRDGKTPQWLGSSNSNANGCSERNDDDKKRERGWTVGCQAKGYGHSG